MEFEQYKPEEEEAIKKLKERVVHKLTPRLLHDETFFYRFLKARNFNLNQAEDMILKHLADRKYYQIEEQIESYKPPQFLSTYLPLNLLGFDKDGSIIYYIDFGKIDPKGILCLFSFKQIIQHSANLIEKGLQRMMEHSKKLGKSQTKMTVIINLDQLNLFMATYKKGIECLIKGVILFQDNYPERVKSMYLINCAFYFTLAFPLVKAILASSILEKINIFGRDGWREALLDVVDADVLPAFLGGKKTDPDNNPLCLTFITHGKKVPEELYPKKECKLYINENGVKKLIVTRFSCSEIKFYISEPNTVIEWEFETKTRDIDFGLYYKDSSKLNPNLEELIPKQRVDTLMSSESGIYQCDKIGTYIIVFDNTYSWIFSKEIYYRIRLTKQNQQQSPENQNCFLEKTGIPQLSESMKDS